MDSTSFSALSQGERKTKKQQQKKQKSTRLISTMSRFQQWLGFEAPEMNIPSFTLLVSCALLFANTNSKHLPNYII